MKKMLLAVLLAVWPLADLFPQNAAIDSLKRELGRVQGDKEKAKLYKELVNKTKKTDITEAAALVEEALLWAKGKPNDYMVFMLTLKSGFYSDQFQDKEALKAGEQGLGLITETTTDSLTVMLYAQLVGIHGGLRNFDKADFYLKKTGEKSNYQGRHYAVALGNSSLMYLNEGVYDSAIVNLDKAKTVFILLNDRLNEASCHLNLYPAYARQGLHKRALDHALQAEKIYRSLDHKQGVARAVSNIGGSYQSMKQFDKAIVYFKESLAVQKSVPGASYSISTFSIASNFNELGNQDSALYYNQEAFNLFSAEKDTIGLSDCYMVFGSIYSKLKQHEKSNEYLFKSISLYEQIGGNDHNVPKAYTYIGENFLNLGKTDKAEHYLKKGIEISRAIKSWQSLAPGLFMMSEAYSKKNDFKNALISYKEASAIYDSIYNIESQKSMDDMREKYETDKKDDQLKLQQAEMETKDLQNRNLKGGIGFVIALAAVLAVAFFSVRRAKAKEQLQKEKAEAAARELETANADLHDSKQMLAENNVMLATLKKLFEHTVQNDIPIMKEFGEYPLQNTGASPKELKKLEDFQNKIFARSQIYTTLIDPSCDSRFIDDHIKNIVFNMSKSYGARRLRELSVTAGQPTPPEQDLKILMEVFTELARNSMKYGFPNGYDDARIIITVAQNGAGEINIDYRDNGIGFAEKTPAGMAGHGLALLEPLARCQTQNHPEGGAQVLVSYKLKGI